MMKKNRTSAFILILLCILMLAGRLWKPSQRPISWDVGGYYLYLPAQFIYHDLGMNDYAKFDSLRIKYEVSSTFYQIYKTPRDKFIVKYTMGNSLFYMPFFFIGHVIAKTGGYPADGFSAPYQMAVMWGSFIYGFLALYFARKILLHFFKDGVAAFTLFAMVMGTNLFFTLSLDNLLSHSNLFFLYTVLIWSTIRFHQEPSFKKAAVMGLFGGLIILVRPTDIVSWLIPLFWGIGSFGDLFRKVKAQFKYFLVFFIVAIIVFSPQMLYWKMYAGSWLYNSYNNPGEGLDLWGPHTFKFLFSYRKGWLIYTPLMIFSFLGILISIKDRSKIFLSVFLFACVNLWLVSSWTCWWYAGSFSSRAMVQSYAVMMIPLGFFVQFIVSKKKIFTLAGRTVLLMVIFFCMFQTWQYTQGILKSDRMTKAFYWRTFGSTVNDPANEKYLLKDKFLETDTIPDPQDFHKARVYEHNFNNQYGFDVETRSRFIQLEGETDYSLRLNSEKVFYTIQEDDYFNITCKYYAYFRVEGDILNTGDLGENPVSLVSHMMHQGKTYGYSARTISIGNGDTIATTWRKFKMDYIFPDVRKPEDKFKTYFWLRGSDPVYVKNVKAYVLEANEFPELE